MSLKCFVFYLLCLCLNAKNLYSNSIFIPGNGTINDTLSPTYNPTIITNKPTMNPTSFIYDCNQTNCNVNCGVDQNCVNAVINGTQADALYVNCNANYCLGLTVICPIDGKICSINCKTAACNGTIIKGNNVSELNVECQGCKDSSIELSTKTNYISCNSGVGRGCYNSNIYSNNDNDIISLNCIGYDACYNMNIDVKTPKEMHIFCQADGSCYFKPMNIVSTKQMIDFTLTCNNANSCVNHYCNETRTSIPSTINATNIRITCNGENSCQYLGLCLKVSKSSKATNWIGYYSSNFEIICQDGRACQNIGLKNNYVDEIKPIHYNTTTIHCNGIDACLAFYLKSERGFQNSLAYYDILFNANCECDNPYECIGNKNNSISWNILCEDNTKSHQYTQWNGKTCEISSTIQPPNACCNQTIINNINNKFNEMNNNSQCTHHNRVLYIVISGCGLCLICTIVLFFYILIKKYQELKKAINAPLIQNEPVSSPTVDVEGSKEEPDRIDPNSHSVTNTMEATVNSKPSLSERDSIGYQENNTNNQNGRPPATGDTIGVPHNLKDPLKPNDDATETEQKYPSEGDHIDYQDNKTENNTNNQNGRSRKNTDFEG